MDLQGPDFSDSRGSNRDPKTPQKTLVFSMHSISFLLRATEPE